MKIFQCVPVFFRLSIRAEIEEKYTKNSRVTHLKKNNNKERVLSH